MVHVEHELYVSTKPTILNPDSLLAANEAIQLHQQYTTEQARGHRKTLLIYFKLKELCAA